MQICVCVPLFSYSSIPLITKLLKGGIVSIIFSSLIVFRSLSSRFPLRALCPNPLCQGQTNNCHLPRSNGQWPPAHLLLTSQSLGMLDHFPVLWGPSSLSPQNPRSSCAHLPHWLLLSSFVESPSPSQSVNPEALQVSVFGAHKIYTYPLSGLTLRQALSIYLYAVDSQICIFRSNPPPWTPYSYVQLRTESQHLAISLASLS